MLTYEATNEGLYCFQLDALVIMADGAAEIKHYDELVAAFPGEYYCTGYGLSRPNEKTEIVKKSYICKSPEKIQRVKKELRERGIIK